MEELYVIGFVYNHNGMATWCIESAFALHEAGKKVVLVCAESLKEEIEGQRCPFLISFLPEDLAFQALSTNQWKRKLDWFLGIFSGASSGWVSRVAIYLTSHGYKPTYYLLNQSDLQDSQVKTPQYVVAWAYPSTLRGYLAKSAKQSKKWISKEFVMALANAISWYYKDHRAYRAATGVLAVSERLTKSLKAKRINAHKVYPCLRFPEQRNMKAMPLEGTRKKVLLAAVDLESEQKRIPWVLSSFENADFKEQLEFHLVGGYTTLPQQTAQWGLHTVFKGRMQRSELLAYMEEMDLFIFGSSFDDWGYVQVEALSRGVAVVAPNISPCDEIIGDDRFLYEANSKVDLKSKVKATLKDLSLKKDLKYFSSEHFAQEVEKIIKRIK